MMGTRYDPCIISKRSGQKRLDKVNHAIEKCNPDMYGFKFGIEQYEYAKWELRGMIKRRNRLMKQIENLKKKGVIL